MGENIQNLLVLKYHHINDTQESSTAIDNCVNCETFCSQLSTILGWGYVPISMNELTDFFYEDTVLPEKAFLVTFDGGYQDIYTKAFHYLKHYSIPAHVFLIADYIEKNFNDEEENEYSRLLKLTEILKMKKSGLISFGCHSATHRNLIGLSKEELYNEISGSKFKLEKLIDCEIDSFAYPYDVHDKHIKSLIKDAGYKTAFITKKAKMKRSLDTYSLPRIEMGNDDKSLALWYKVFKSELKTFDIAKV